MKKLLIYAIENFVITLIFACKNIKINEICETI